jgi:hypothetical protein
MVHALVNIAHLRRLLTVRGLTPAHAVPDTGVAREDARIRPARLLEDSCLAWHPIGAPEPWPDPVAFLDGVQRLELLAYAGAAPLVVGEVAAAVRERRLRRLTRVLDARRVLLLGRPCALDAAGEALGGVDTVALPAEEPAHPARDLANASRALDRTRGALELSLGVQYRRGSAGWLLVDGVLTESPSWAADSRTVGVARNHATLPFDGGDLERWLRLPAAHRTSVYAPETRSVTPVLEWALRLWPWEGRDLFHGLVRVQVAPENGTPERADLISRRLLAERAPLSPIGDGSERLLYGMHSVQRFLRAAPAHY